MDQGNLEEFAELRSMPEDRGKDDDSCDQDFFEMPSFLDGSTQVPVSHAGGEFEELQEGIEAEMASKETQMDDMVDGYMEWCTEQELGAQLRARTDGEPEKMDILVVELFETYNRAVILNTGGRGVATALIKQGLVPCAPFEPKVLAVQSFVKSLCDLHGVPYRPYLCQQFTICYDL
ncbi:hypothetical protein C8J57DRAFT_1521249 [Mycena rebaudengoi]|nr:hypothetical protein C8J57DRAFT_1521249 [Mycena rebaudengoi]